jgi:hypothetical protein
MILIAVISTLAALVVLGLLNEVLAILLAAPPVGVTSIRLGPPAEAGAAEPLPRIVWTYWETLAVPAIVEQCLATWRRHAPDHEIRLVDKATAAAWLRSADEARILDALPAYRQADWLRLQLLNRHGGIWIDGSTLLTQGLDWVHVLNDELGGGVVGFYIDRYTTDPARPMLENWFIAAPPADPFIAAWAIELDRAIGLGEAAYRDALRREGLLESAAQGIPVDMQSYLVMHLAAAVVALRAPGIHRQMLRRAEDVAFAFHAALRWRKRHLYARLALTPRPRRVPALVKLRSGDRAVVEKGLARGLLWRRSLLARLLAGEA